MSRVAIYPQQSTLLTVPYTPVVKLHLGNGATIKQGNHI